MTTSPSDTEVFDPVVWIDGAIKAQKTAQQHLSLDLMIPGNIDEVSILFKSVGMMERFIGWAEQFGWHNFATVKKDTAEQLFGNSLAQIGNVAGPAFDVRFEFLKMRKDPSSFRIECMCILDGFAPLHERLPQGAVAHASWKAANRLHYQQVCEQVGRALPKMAEYENSYGRFAYYGNEAPHFKPRINMRDTRVQPPMPRL
jgi:hypothetical protein